MAEWEGLDAAATADLDAALAALAAAPVPDAPAALLAAIAADAAQVAQARRRAARVSFAGMAAAAAVGLALGASGLLDLTQDMTRAPADPGLSQADLLAEGATLAGLFGEEG